MQTDGVILPRGQPASAVLHGILREAVERFPRALLALRLPESPDAFRTRYPELLARFEAARLASAQHAEIARCVVEASRRAFCLTENGVERPLGEALAAPAEPLPLELHAPRGKTRLEPAVLVGPKFHRGRELRGLAERMRARDAISSGAARALVWLSQQPELDLAGRRFAVLGAAAELAPTRMLLEGGADVLWIDVKPPPSDLLAEPLPRGRLLLPRQTADLLQGPRQIAATLVRFAEAGPLDLCLYAYAPGQAREWRLCAAMNAIAESLEPGAIRSLCLLVSPTSPLVLEPGDVHASLLRRGTRPGWQALLEAVGGLGTGPHVKLGEVHVLRGVVGLQGASYQAAQYLEKILTAWTWAEAGRHVCASVAGVTRTRSMEHPVFAAAFRGASAFGVETFTPQTSRGLSNLLVLHDLLAGPEPPAPLASRVHGGLHVLPYSVDAALRIAALIGFARRPLSLLDLLRRRS